MIRDEFYTDKSAVAFVKLSIDTEAKEYELIDNLSESEIDMDFVDFLSPKVFNLLIAGLETKGYSKI